MIRDDDEALAALARSLPPSPALAWYVERADYCGTLVDWLLNDAPGDITGSAYTTAREAGHWGRLALSETVSFSKDEQDVLVVRIPYDMKVAYVFGRHGVFVVHLDLEGTGIT